MTNPEQTTPASIFCIRVEDAAGNLVGAPALFCGLPDWYMNDDAGRDMLGRDLALILAQLQQGESARVLAIL